MHPDADEATGIPIEMLSTKSLTQNHDDDNATDSTVMGVNYFDLRISPIESQEIVDSLLPALDSVSLLSLYNALLEHMNEKQLTRARMGLSIPTESLPIRDINDDKETSRFFNTDALSVLVYSSSGYNFSAEYELIYRGPSPSLSTLPDYKVVIERALRVYDSSLTDNVCSDYVTGILASIIIQESVCCEMCYNSFTRMFPTMSPSLETSTHFPIRVLLGKNHDGDLTYCIRMCVEFSNPSQEERRVFANGPHSLYMSYAQQYLVSKSSDKDDKNDLNAVTSSMVHVVCAKNTAAYPSYLEDDSNMTEQQPTTTASHDDMRPPLPDDMPAKESESSVADVFTWGAVGVDSKALQDLSLVPLPPPLLRERVRMLACSQSHCLALSWAGSVFAYGDNDEGALGVGDLAARASFVPIDFSKYEEYPLIRKIAVGSCVIGSHSLALDDQGKLFSWGVAYANGLGKAKSTLYPTLVSTFLTKAPVDDVDAPTIFGQAKVTSIACGGGFSLAVLENGEVSSWGLWVHGRLGRGRPPVQNATGFRGKAKLARYSLTPQSIKGVTGASEVSCGDAHALCLTIDGTVLAWGLNSSGQLGIGVQDSGFLSDKYVPTKIAFPTASRARMVQCGANHSIAVDSDGLVWSWGGRGGPCLGRQSLDLQGAWKAAVDSVMGAKQTHRLVPYELVQWCDSWATAGVVSGVNGEDVRQISAGDSHSIFLTDSNRILLCGEGPIVPPVILQAIEGHDDDEKADDGQQLPRGNDDVSVQQMFTCWTPRSPSSLWMDRICTRKVLFIASSGFRCFAIQGEDLIGKDLGELLYRRLQGTASAELDSVEDDDVSLDSAHMHSSSRSVFEDRGSADCIVITAGKVLLAHQALLSQRNRFLRELILDESPMDGSQTICQILLPELRYDTARALMYFLYTDKLPARSLTDITLLYALSRAAKSMSIPRLAILTDATIRLLSIHELGDSDESTDMPPCTLAKDLSSLVGDPTFADIRFLAEGKVIYAHRFILQHRCQYFNIMFRSGMSESSSEMQGIFDVTVPDTFIGFLRLLIFIYTSTLPEGSDGQLLEDLLSADRYQLMDMKSLVVHMLQVNQANWLDLLRAASIVDAPKILSDVQGYLYSNYEQAINTSLSAQLREEFPGFLEMIETQREMSFPSPPNTAYKRRIQSRNEEIEKSKRFSTTFPLWIVGVLLLVIVLYRYLISTMDLGVMIPAMNIVVTLAILYYGYRYATSK